MGEPIKRLTWPQYRALALAVDEREVMLAEPGQGTAQEAATLERAWLVVQQLRPLGAEK